MDSRLKSCLSIAESAGEAIMRVYNSPEKIEAVKKSDRSPLTEADLAANRIIVEGLKKLTPEIPVISEESALPSYSERKDWRSFWLVDPLDGTKEFLKRNGEFTVNIALVVEGAPILGVIWAPALKLLYFGSREDGSFKRIEGGSIERITSQVPDVTRPISIVESRSHPSPELESFLRGYQIKERIVSGSSIKICLVAEGKADLYPRLGPTMEWDVAAGDAIFRYSGRHQARSSPLTYNKPELRNSNFILGLS